MFGSIVVGTDGSNTAQEAVRQASELARALGAKVYLVSAYEPVPEGRLRDERQVLPADLQWMVNPREDVEETLDQAAGALKAPGSKWRRCRVRGIPPMPSSTWPRRRTPT